MRQSSSGVSSGPDGEGTGLRVAAAQMCSQDDVGANLRQAEQLVRAARGEGAKLVVLPEGCFFLGPESQKCHVAESFEEEEPETAEGPMAHALRRWARDHGIYIMAGGVPESSSDASRPFNTSVLVSPQGTFVARYRKMHLFEVDLSDGTSWHESKATTAGDAPAVAAVDGTTWGMSICYDLRFPELYAHYKARGAQVLSIPAAFTRTTGRAHWHVLLRARAIETQCFVVAAAQEGDHPRGRQTFGHSLIVDPWGEVLAERSQSGHGLVCAELSMTQLVDLRRRMPVDDHRRLTGLPRE